MPLHKFTTREEWLIARRQGIGASDAAAILGLSPYRTPLQTWSDKMGLEKRNDDNKFKKSGRMQEKVVLEMYAEEKNCEITTFENELIQSEENSILFASLDGKVTKAQIGLEGKTGNSEAWHWRIEPPHYQVQAQMQLLVTGFEQIDIPALIDGNTFKIFSVTPDKEFQGLMNERLTKWWNDYVVPKVPPPETDVYDLGEYTDRKFPKSSGLMIVAQGETLALCEKLKSAMIELHAVKARADACENALKYIIGDNAGILLPDGKKITWKKSADSFRTHWEQIVDALRIELGADFVNFYIEKFSEPTKGTRRFVTPWDRVK